MSFDILSPLIQLNSQISRRRELETERAREDALLRERREQDENTRQEQLFQQLVSSIDSGSIQSADLLSSTLAAQGVEYARGQALHERLKEVKKTRNEERQRAEVSQINPDALGRLLYQGNRGDAQSAQAASQILAQQRQFAPETADVQQALAGGAANAARFAATGQDVEGLRDLVMRQRDLEQRRKELELTTRDTGLQGLVTAGALASTRASLAQKYVQGLSAIESRSGELASRTGPAFEGKPGFESLHALQLDRIRAKQIEELDQRIVADALAATKDPDLAPIVAYGARLDAEAQILKPIVENEGRKAGADLFLEAHAGSVTQRVAAIAAQEIASKGKLQNVQMDPVSQMYLPVGGSPGFAAEFPMKAGRQADTMAEIVVLSDEIRKKFSGDPNRFQREITKVRELIREDMTDAEALAAVSSPNSNIDALFISLANAIQRSIQAEVVGFAATTFTDRILDFVTQMFPNPGTLKGPQGIDQFRIRQESLTRGMMASTLGGVPISEREEYNTRWRAGFSSFVEMKRRDLALDRGLVDLSQESSTPFNPKKQGARAADPSLGQKNEADAAYEAMMRGLQ